MRYNCINGAQGLDEAEGSASLVQMEPSERWRFVGIIGGRRRGYRTPEVIETPISTP